MSEGVNDQAQEGTEVEPAVAPEPAPVEAGRTGRRAGSRRRRWPFVLAGALVLAVALAVVGWQVLLPADPTARQITATVSRQNLKRTVGTTGTINPARRADLSFADSATVTSVDVSVGDHVSKGDVLATINDDSLQAAVDSARAALDASKENLGELEDSSDATDTQLRSAEADVKLKRSQWKQAKQALKGATLTAPFDGLVAAVNITKGTTSGSGSGSGSGSAGETGSTAGGDSHTPVGSSSDSSGSSSNSSSGSSSAAITLINTSSWVVDATVGATDLPSIKKGQQVRLTQTGSSQTIFGTVSSVGVMSTDGSGDFPVKIKITGSPKGLYAGSSANVSIIVKQLHNALVVPTIALRTVNGQAVVDKVTGGKTVQTRVTIGGTFGSQTQITSGLAQGDQVAITIPGASQRPADSGQGGGLFGGRRDGFPGGHVPGGGQVVTTGKR